MLGTSHAKVNLALNVVNKTKPTGFHELDCIDVTINLKDYMYMSFTKDGEKKVTIKCNKADVPLDESNLITKVIRKFQKNFKITDSITVSLKKNIPMSAGLGGGSSNAATTLDMLNRHYKTNMNISQRCKFLEDISSDAVFIEVGQISRVKGTGNKVEPLKIAVPYKIFLIKPKSSCNTAKIYGSLDYKNLKHFNINKAINALEKNDLKAFSLASGNSLQDAAIKDNNELENILSRLRACEFDYVAVSGSGSTCIAIAKSKWPYKVVKKLFNKDDFELFGTYKVCNYID